MTIEELQTKYIELNNLMKLKEQEVQDLHELNLSLNKNEIDLNEQLMSLKNENESYSERLIVQDIFINTIDNIEKPDKEVD